MSSPINQVAERMAQLEAQYGRRRFPLTPHSPMPRDARLRRDVFARLKLPPVIEARVESKAAFARGDGSYASLLVCRTSAVVEAFLFEGVPGIRTALIDLAAFALVLASCLDTESPIKPPRSPK